MACHDRMTGKSCTEVEEAVSHIRLPIISNTPHPLSSPEIRSKGICMPHSLQAMSGLAHRGNLSKNFQSFGILRPWLSAYFRLSVAHCNFPHVGSVDWKTQCRAHSSFRAVDLFWLTSHGFGDIPFTPVMILPLRTIWSPCGSGTTSQEGGC